MAAREQVHLTGIVYYGVNMLVCVCMMDLSTMWPKLYL
jgi:hypothetical protein